MGTIRDRDMAQQAVDYGAQLLVTYKVAEDVARIAQQNHLPFILGAMTPTEVDHCVQLGCSVVKLFPAGVVSTAMIKDLKGPMPAVDYFPTGGIGIDEVGRWLEAGAMAVGIGGALLRGSQDEIRRNTAHLLANFAISKESQ